METHMEIEMEAGQTRLCKDPIIQIILAGP